MDRTPPPNYVCFRCNKPGHYIQFCPTNNDPKFDIARRRAPVGIPRSQLKRVAGPPILWYRLIGRWPDCADQRGQLWRLWTYQFAHKGWLHLGGNLAIQLALGLPIEMVHGPLAMMCIYWVGVVTGALTCAMFDPYSNVVGASGGAPRSASASRPRSTPALGCPP